MRPAWLYLGCVGLVAYSFRRDIHAPASQAEQSLRRTWRTQMGACSIAVLSAWAVFALGCLARNGVRDAGYIFLGFFALAPALCVTPCLTLATRRPFAAVVFTLFLTIAMKLLGAIVVVSLYGWDADSKGYLTMPWLDPNLLVWLFYANTLILSFGLYHLGARLFARNPNAPDAWASPLPG